MSSELTLEEIAECVKNALGCNVVIEETNNFCNIPGVPRHCHYIHVDLGFFVAQGYDDKKIYWIISYCRINGPRTKRELQKFLWFLSKREGDSSGT